MEQLQDWNLQRDRTMRLFFSLCPWKGRTLSQSLRMNFSHLSHFLTYEWEVLIDFLIKWAWLIVSGKSRRLVSTPLNLVLTDSKVGTGGKKGWANGVTKIPKYTSCLLMRTTIMNKWKKSTELKPSPWEECQTFFPYAYIVKEADKEWWIHFLSDITLAKWFRMWFIGSNKILDHFIPMEVLISSKLDVNPARSVEVSSVTEQLS